MVDMRIAYAWAAVSKSTGKVLRDLKGHYSIWTHAIDAIKDCPSYGVVKRVRLGVKNAR